MAIVQTTNPFTGETIREWEQMDFAALKESTARARSAFGDWQGLPVVERVERVQAALDYFKTNREAIAGDITAQMGRPLAEALGELDGLLERFIYLCDLAPEVLAAAAIEEKENFHREIFFIVGLNKMEDLRQILYFQLSISSQD